MMTSVKLYFLLFVPIIMFIKILVESFLCGAVKLNMIVPWIEIKPKIITLYNP